jgi:hypothetical protein
VLILNGEYKNATKRQEISYSKIFNHDFSANILVFQPQLMIGAQEEVDRAMPEIISNLIKTGRSILFG